MRKETYVYYNLKVSDELVGDNKKKVLAYQIETDNLTQCFLRVIDTKLIDPAVFSAHEVYHGDEHFVKVKPDIYQKYLEVISGNSKVTLRTLERAIDNG